MDSNTHTRNPTSMWDINEDCLLLSLRREILDIDGVGAADAKSMASNCSSLARLEVLEEDVVGFVGEGGEGKGEGDNGCC